MFLEPLEIPSLKFYNNIYASPKSHLKDLKSDFRATHGQTTVNSPVSSLGYTSGQSQLKLRNSEITNKPSIFQLNRNDKLRQTLKQQELKLHNLEMPNFSSYTGNFTSKALGGGSNPNFKFALTNAKYFASKYTFNSKYDNKSPPPLSSS